MKKKLAMLLALLCLLSLLVSFTGSAFAEEAQYTATKDFLSFLDQKEIKYEYLGVSDDRERVSVEFELDNFPSLTCYLIFNYDNEEVSLRIWNIVTASAGKNYILTTLNSIEYDYKFVKFVYDESDSTVQAEMDMYIDGNHCGRSVYDAMMAMFNVTDNEEVAPLLHALE